MYCENACKFLSLCVPLREFQCFAEPCEQAPNGEDVEGVEATKYEKTIWESDQLPIVIIFKNSLALVSCLQQQTNLEPTRLEY